MSTQEMNWKSCDLIYLIGLKIRVADGKGKGSAQNVVKKFVTDLASASKFPKFLSFLEDHSRKL